MSESYPWPTFEEVESYAKENNLAGKVILRKFYDYYAKQDFMYRGRPMDWKDRLFYWAQTEKKKTGLMKPAAQEERKDFPKEQLKPWLRYKGDERAYLEWLTKQLEKEDWP